MTENFSNFAITTLNGNINGSVGSLVVSSAARFPAAPFRIVVSAVDSNGVMTNPEIMLVTAKSGTTFTVTRAQESTTGVSHVSGEKVAHVFTAGLMTQTQQDICDICNMSRAKQIGEIWWWGGSIATIPAGAFHADGSEKSRTGPTANLFSAIGIIWGSGNGISTFHLPDFRNRTIFGAFCDNMCGVPVTTVTGSDSQYGGCCEHNHGINDCGHTHVYCGNTSGHSHSASGSVDSHCHGFSATGSGHNHNFSATTGTPNGTTCADSTINNINVADECHTHNVSGTTDNAADNISGFTDSQSPGVSIMVSSNSDSYGGVTDTAYACVNTCMGSTIPPYGVGVFVIQYQ